MNFDQIVSSLRQKALTLEFDELVLTQNAAKRPIVYRGSGRIFQTPDDEITFELNTATVENTDWAQAVRAQFNVQSGKVYAASDFYSLRGKMIDGTEWTADRILPNTSWPADALPTVGGRIDRLLSSRSAEVQTNELTVVFFEHVILPMQDWTRHGTADDAPLRRDTTRLTAAGAALIQAATVLMYHAVFYIIGYYGSYTDYSAHGWPTQDISGRPSNRSTGTKFLKKLGCVYEVILSDLRKMLKRH